MRDLVDFEDTPSQAQFRAELRDWLGDHLVGEYRSYLGVGGPTDDAHWEIRLAWERELAAGRWLNVTWPVDYGGRGGTLEQEVITYLEFARVRGAVLGRGAGARPVRADAAALRQRSSSRRVSFPRSRRPKSSGVRVSASRKPAATSPGCAPAPASTATSG